MIQEQCRKWTGLVAYLIFAGIFSPQAGAQQSTNLTVKIPIKKDRRYYNYTTEDGKGRVCGVRLYGVFDVFKNYTNISSYPWRVALVGIQNPSSPSLVIDGDRRYFQVYCYFNGSAGPDGPNVDCNHTIGESLPDWEMTLTRTPPKANFTTTFYPSAPGEVKFQATSIDPEDPAGNALMHAWDFGDNATSSGDIETHRYIKPGRFNVKLTATNPDGLVGSATREVRIPANRPIVSMQLFNKHSLNRIEPDEEFRVRVTVEASTDGLGSLTNLVFNGAALTVPSTFTVVGAPAATNIGNLQAGQKMEFDWVLRAIGLGNFTIVSGSVSGRDEAGQIVSGSAASQRGEVTALLAGIRQNPERIVLGEDNNGDGIINDEDSRVQIVIGVTNVAAVDVTEVQTDNIDRPINFTTRLPALGVSLNPVGTHSGSFGTIRPGAANAVVRTNVFEATNYVYATASLLVRGKIDTIPVQTGTETVVKVQQPGVKVTMHALEKSGLTPASIAQGTTSINAPLVPVTATASLDGQPEVTSGLIGDGVTPLLFILEGDKQALAVANEELKIRLVATVKSGGKLAGSALQDRIKVLKSGDWVSSDLATMTQAEPKAYVFLTPVQSDEIETAAGSGSLKAALRIEDSEKGTEIEEFEFALRKPPIALVHGYNTDGTWGNEFREILGASRPVDEKSGIAFVRTVRYGQMMLDGGGLLASPIFKGAETLRINTLWPLEDLVPILNGELEKEMKVFKAGWAFTRYDVVAHSQGGVLSRMLSADNPNATFRQPFRNEANHFRGRFHRVVTIGSPHNGTRLLHYFFALKNAAGPFNVNLPNVIGTLSVLIEASQDKFDPWGEQIRNLNQPASDAPWHPDSGAPFHLVRTTVNNGHHPGVGIPSFVDKVFGLNLPGVGNVVIPRGSDAIVDFDAMAATAPDQEVPPNVYTVPLINWISHARLSKLGYDDIFGGDAGQVESPVVAQHVIAALNQDSSIPAAERVFSPFRVPNLLPDGIRRDIDLAAETQGKAFGEGYQPAEITTNSPALLRVAAASAPRIFNLQLNPSPNQPVDSGGVKWLVEAFGTNGVTIEGITLVADASNTTRATVQISNNFTGDVVAHAVYTSASNRTILAKPFRVASYEPASPAIEILLLPQGTTNPVGGYVAPQLFVRHADQTVIQRFIAPEEVSVVSAGPTIVDVSNPVRWQLKSAGKASVTATWRGLTSTGDVTVFGHARGNLPIPDPLVWLRADAGLSLTNGTNVLSWTDQSRNNFVFASRSEGARPTLFANGGSGPAALRFDPAKRNQLNGNLGQTLSNATIFTLMRLNPQSSTRYIYAFGTRNTSGYMMTLARRGGDDAYHYDGAAEWDNPGTWGDTNFVVLSQVYGGGGPDHHRLDLNGKTVIDSRTTTGRPYSAVTDDVVIGNYLSATYHFSGNFAEWIVYDRTLNETEKAQVEDYLRLRAGLPPFPAKTNITVSSVAFGVGSPDRETAHWTYNPSNGVFRAEGGAAPSVNVLDQAFLGEEVRTRVSANGTNGAIGILLGYQDRGNFYLLDWRAISKTNILGEVAPAGLRLFQFHTPPGVEAPSYNDFYAGTNSLNTTILMVNELTWIPARTYDVILRPSASGLSIEIFDGATQLLAQRLPEWTEPIGWFGHYSHGIEAAEYGPVTISDAQPEEPILISIARGAASGQWTLQWTGSPGLFLLETTTDLRSQAWQPVGTPDSLSSRIISFEDRGGFFRVRRMISP